MPGQRPVHVVFVHGLFSPAGTWTPFTRLIEADPDLAGFVTIHFFEHQSPRAGLRTDRRIPEIDDPADQLHTFMSASMSDAESIVVVTHSQGGLIVQRMLARTLANGEGRDLARIKRIVMFACPNSGSEFILSLPKVAGILQNLKESHLQQITQEVSDTQRTVLQHVINARDCSDTECCIPVAVYGGASDGIAPSSELTSAFPLSGIIEADHLSIVRPANRDSKAFRDLKTELMAATAAGGRRAPGGQAGAQQAAAGDSPAERLANISITPPYGLRDGQLQGREVLITSIMSGAAKPSVHILAGLGGSGKSRLALEIAFRAQAQGWQVWWVSVPRINSGMREVASQLGAAESQVERAWHGAASATDLVWRFLNASTQPWLLILDNADEPTVLSPSDAQVRDGTGWLRAPATGNGMVIVTSRDRNLATWGTWSTVHHVPPLAADDGAWMLTDLLGGYQAGTFEQAKRLSAELGGLPLALRAAADYLKSVINAKVWHGEGGIRDFDAYRAAVKERFGSPLSTRSRDLDEPIGFEIMRNVSGISLELLARRGLTQAAPLLKLFACLNITPIPYHVILDSTLLAESPLFSEFTALQRPTVLSGLEDLGLVNLHAIAGVDDPDLAHVLSLHPVVHGILRGDEDVQSRRADYYGLSVRMLLSATDGFDPDLPENWVIWGITAPHCLEAAKAVALGTPPLADRVLIGSALELARRTARYLIITGLLTPAHDLVVSLIDNCRSFGLQENDVEILGLRHERARIALERGDPKAAEAQLRRIISQRGRLLSEKHPDTLASRHKLAKAILEQGRFAEAEPLLRAIVQAERYVRGPEHSDTMVVRHSLARAILAQGRTAEAESEIRDILRVRALHWSATNPETLFARQTLARALLEQGKIAGAEAEVRAALREAADRPDAPIVLTLRFTQTTVLLWQGRVPEAIADLTELLADRVRVLGASHPETLRTEQTLEQLRAEQALARTRDETPHVLPKPDTDPSD
jgi:hypothetical protein